MEESLKRKTRRRLPLFSQLFSAPGRSLRVLPIKPAHSDAEYDGESIGALIVPLPL
jgi:hypothetical protein